MQKILKIIPQQQNFFFSALIANFYAVFHAFWWLWYQACACFTQITALCIYLYQLTKLLYAISVLYKIPQVSSLLYATLPLFCSALHCFIMKGLEDLQQHLAIYNGIYPSENIDLQLFTDFLSNNTCDTIIDRNNFNGHITTSAFIVNATHTQLLLLHHKTLNRWLQPGGHGEITDDSLLSSALREAEEETGIAAGELINIPLVAHTPTLPFDIDSHFIPPNPRKGEPGHYHHDFRYIFVYNGSGNYNFNASESTGLQWVQLTDMATDDTFASVAAKISRFLATSGAQ